MSFGKSGGTQVTTAELSPEQRALIGAQTNALTGTFLPAYQQAVGGVQDLYTNLQPNIAAATQNLQGTAAQAQNVLGSTGESALRTGISGLQNLFGQGYEQQQINAAMAPAQAQYQQNLAGQQAQFGGAGQLGSARQALADRQLAGMTQAQQAQIAAQVSSGIAGQRASAASQLAQLGQGGIGQGLGAAGQGVTAPMANLDAYAKAMSVLFGTPSAQVTPDFRGTQGSTVGKSTFEAGIGGSGGSSPFKIGF